MTPTIQLINGKYLDLVDPDPEVFDAFTVATSLAKECRFTNHCRGHYSVAQHTVLAARALYNRERDLSRLALHHEDDEVATGDISGPLKLLIGGALRPISKRIQHAAWARFEVESDPESYAWVKHVDERLRVTEKRDLMPHNEEDDEQWAGSGHLKPFTETIVPLERDEAAAQWLATWSYLMPADHALGGPFCSRVLPVASGCWPEYDVIKYKTRLGNHRRAIVHRSLVGDGYLIRAFDNLQHEGPLE